MFINSVSLRASSIPVKSATIFQSSTAELTRCVTIELKNGRNVLEISGLSSKLDTESPRLSGAPGGVRVLDVVCKRKPRDAPDTPEDERSAEIRSLKAERRALQAEQEVRQEEIKLLNDSAQLVTHDDHNHNPDHDKLLDFMDKYVQRKLGIQKAIRDIFEQIEEVDKRIYVLNNARKGETTTMVTATIIAASDCKVDLNLTYLISGVTWRPFYDLHATSVDGQPSRDVSVRYCVAITQSTGEDWENMALTLSTASSQALRQLTVPALSPHKIIVPGSSISVDPPPRPMRRMGTIRARKAVNEDDADNAPPDDMDMLNVALTSFSCPPAAVLASAPPAPPPVPPSLANRNALSVVYRVQGAVSLPSDGEEHRLTIATLDFQAKLKYMCVPRQRPTVYIVAKVKNTSEFDLLSGPVNVFMNDSYVTKTAIPFITMDESFPCVLGVDAALKVSYVQDEKTEYEPKRNFAEPQKTTTRTLRVTVTNLHKFDIGKLVIRDAIPLGNGEDKVAVVLRKPEGLAESKDGQDVVINLNAEGSAEGTKATAKVRWQKVVDGKGGEKDGLFEWVCAVPAGEKIDLDAQWDIKAPSETQWQERATR
ncbi:hypothetical protein ONZ51_g5381 [Trametes cubensis]|uniref:Protein F37C4.5 n=1 Tax=Trametes cubensis TaxID=1111947 RepID=A0AAD7XBK8_9APHY|nr:hypothetical protein ONZ51_g5381 [Trametes cubensis]